MFEPIAHYLGRIFAFLFIEHFTQMPHSCPKQLVTMGNPKVGRMHHQTQALLNFEWVNPYISQGARWRGARLVSNRPARASLGS
jgi:hypothetical protein